MTDGERRELVTITAEGEAMKLHPLMQTLRDLRIAKKIPQKVLAWKSGYSYNTIRQWECGLRFPEGRALYDLCEALGCELVVRDLP